MKIICYQFTKEGKLMFGKVTPFSWVKAFFFKGSLIKVKPIKGYKKFFPYKKCWYTLLNHSHFTNDFVSKDPINNIICSEQYRGRSEINIVAIRSE